ncbi:helix-turn-helix domain-containing protein [Methylophilus sp. TWE2]|uniref:helix-turn-helix domain-containing protein n=1 Tax=Methylophilus sp. TWE2 TaxID=1662285 RepID=UPI000671210C|nr:XRE family transcriptional regulator [Methylophilus sp. TWE2]
MTSDLKKNVVPMTETESKPLGKHLGNVIKEVRKQHGLTIADVAERANISVGMFSKIENGHVSTSLETLEQVANALGVTLSRLFRDYNAPSGNAQFVKKGHGMEVVRRGTKLGHTYHLLAYDQGPQKTFEPFLITLEDQAEEFPPFEHGGTEFIHMLEGVLEYKVGLETFLLEPGDSLTFRGDQPHQPARLIEVPIRFLAIIHHDPADHAGGSEWPQS